MTSSSLLCLIAALLKPCIAAYRGNSQAEDCIPNELDPDGDCIFGSAGQDYPSYATVPDTGFPCSQLIPGIYADQKAECQVYHMCLKSGARHSFLCPNGTLFHQAYFVCDSWFNVDCEKASDFYSLNQHIYKRP